MKRELDTADRKIVELLQEDARLPLKSIADKVSLTSPTVSARIDRLEKDGVITGYRASVNPEVLTIGSRHSSIWRLSRCGKRNSIRTSPTARM